MDVQEKLIILEIQQLFNEDMLKMSMRKINRMLCNVRAENK